MKIMVLGHNGMLGHMLVKYLNSEGVFTETTKCRFPTPDFRDAIYSFEGDYIVNCIGAIPQRTKDFSINQDLPIWLDSSSDVRIIHPGTDCEIDKDDYGLSKKNARDFIVKKGLRTKILKASVIGPELGSKSSLLEWFLGCEGAIVGYSNAMWSGVTTLEWSKHCFKIMLNWSQYDVENIIQSTCLSKFELLCLFRDVFNKRIDITPSALVRINKCLTGGLQSKHINEQLVELKRFYF